MAENAPPIWAKVFVGKTLVYPEYAFAVTPARGTTFHIVKEEEVYEIESVEPDPEFPGRFIVHAKRLS